MPSLTRLEEVGWTSKSTSALRRSCWPSRSGSGQGGKAWTSWQGQGHTRLVAVPHPVDAGADCGCPIGLVEVAAGVLTQLPAPPAQGHLRREVPARPWQCGGTWEAATAPAPSSASRHDPCLV